MLAKTQKSNFFSILDIHLQQFFVSSLYPFDFMFSGIIWINKWLDCDEKTCFPCFFKNMNLTDINYH